MSSAAQTSTITLLAQAAKQAQNYDWKRSADLYKQVLESLDLEHDATEQTRITELLAKSYFKAAFQAQSRDEFVQKMHLAEAAYARACAAYETAGSVSLATMFRARGLLSSFWLEGHTTDKSIIEKCVKLAEEAASVFERDGENDRLAETHQDILAYLLQQFWLCTESKELNGIFEDGVELGEKTIAEFGALGDDDKLLESLNLTVEFLTFVAFFAAEQGRFRQREKYAESLVARVAELSKKIGSLYARSIAFESAARVEHFFKGTRTKALELFEAAIASGDAVKDSYRTGRLLSEAGIDAFWMAIQAENVEEKRALLVKAALLFSKAIESLETSSHLGSLGYSYGWLPECETYLGYSVESELEKKREHLRRSIEIARRGSVLSKGHGTAWGIGHSLSKALYFLSLLTTDVEEKKQLLKEALPIRVEVVKRTENLEPHSWDNGVMHNYLALIKAELSKVEKNPQTRTELLKEAAAEMQQCVDLCTIWSVTPDSKTALAEYMESYGDILLQVHQLETDDESSLRALRVYEDTITIVTEAGLAGPIGPIRWKIAKTHDAVGDYKQASEAFKGAAEDYRKAAAKIQGLSSTFQEVASYMDSWALIEKARIHHHAEQYSQASEAYDKAASTLQSARHWSHLSKHYQACALIEAAEALSRQEKPEASIQAFSSAVETFRAAKEELESRRKQNTSTPEKKELEDWMKVTDGRIRYSLGRLELEEAKLLDRKGERSSSSSKFESASKIFKGLISDDQSKQTRRELEALALFSEAWARLKEAEERSSPELYSQASESFLKAYEVAEKKFRPLALANSAICKAFQSGILFRRTRDTQLYSGIKRELEAATDYYQEGGFQNAADWTQATQRLFDALLYLSEAETEIEPKKKTELYHLAEKHLELAAKLYDEAGFPTKRDEAQRHLKRVHQEKEILLTPLEALRENPAMTGVATAPVSLIRDQAAGIERFEAANVVGNLTLRQNEVGVGSDIIMDLEMANVGKTAATLMKLENVAPEGLEIDREKVQLRFEDNYLDMKGKRLEYLKTHEARIPMKARRKGTFQLQPRILFVDERGSYRSYEFEPRSITVKELGIAGWLKGPKQN